MSCMLTCIESELCSRLFPRPFWSYKEGSENNLAQECLASEFLILQTPFSEPQAIGQVLL